MRYDYLIIGGGMVADSAARGIREIDGTGNRGFGREDLRCPIGDQHQVALTQPHLFKLRYRDHARSFAHQVKANAPPVRRQPDRKPATQDGGEIEPGLKPQ